MTVQVLVATMNQDDHDLVAKMNIQTSAIVANQCSTNSVEEFYFQDNKITYLNFNETGVGLNRNNALIRADADICLIADDDLTYLNDYEALVKKAYYDYPKADFIIFNLIEKDSARYVIKRPTKVSYFNFLRYGTARFSFRLDAIRNNSICFNQNFGGGTSHSHGEDNIFLFQCLKSNLNVIAVPVALAVLNEDRESTWHRTYDEKYFKDQGILYKTMFKKTWRLFCFQDSVRHSKSYGKSWINSYRAMTRT